MFVLSSSSDVKNLPANENFGFSTGCSCFGILSSTFNKLLISAVCSWWFISWADALIASMLIICVLSILSSTISGSTSSNVFDFLFTISSPDRTFCILGLISISSTCSLFSLIISWTCLTVNLSFLILSSIAFSSCSFSNWSNALACPSLISLFCKASWTFLLNFNSFILLFISFSSLDIKLAISLVLLFPARFW